MVSHWILSDSKSPQVSRTLLCILADLNKAVVWMVSTRPIISKSSSPCTNPLVTVPRAPITIYTTVTFMFPSFFSHLTRSSTYPSFRFLLILLWGQQGKQSPQFGRFSFLLTFTRSGRLAEIRCSVCISKSQSSLCITFSTTDSVLCIYRLFVWSNFNFLYNSQSITLPIQSCLVLYSFYASLLHSLIK